MGRQWLFDNQAGETKQLCRTLQARSVNAAGLRS
jgi:hypothetical protein